MIPASIRCKNPGAMWGRVGQKPTQFFELPEGPHGCETNAPIPKRWGSKNTIYLSDGLGQNNNIAIFDDWVPGICAQIDLWRTPRYYNKRFADAIAVWSGGNNVASYISYVKSRVPGMTEDTVMDAAFWQGPLALGFLRAQAGHEAGMAYPAPEEAWAEAQRLVFSGVKKSTKIATATATATATAVGGASKAAQSGMPGWEIALIIAGVVAVAGLVIWLIHKTHKGA